MNINTKYKNSDLFGMPQNGSLFDMAVWMGLFHQLLERCNQLVDHFVVAVPDIGGNACADMIRKQFLVERVDCGGNSRRLHKNIRAVYAAFDHAAYAADLAFDAVEPVDQALIFFVCTDLGLRRAMAFYFSRIAHVVSFLPYNNRRKSIFL